MKFVYVVEIMQFMSTRNEFVVYDMEVIASDKFDEGDKGVREYVRNMIKCNNGTNLGIVSQNKETTTGFRRGEHETTTFTYKCMSVPAEGEEPKEMKVRYVIRKMEINKNWM